MAGTTKAQTWAAGDAVDFLTGNGFALACEVTTTDADGYVYLRASEDAGHYRKGTSIRTVAACLRRRTRA